MVQNALNGKDAWRSGPWRVAAWSAAAGFMLLPIVAKTVSGDFGWSIGDFLLFGAILLTSCALFDLAARKAPNFSYLAGAGAALAAGFGLFLVNGAVGLVGSEDELHNLLFFPVIFVAIGGAVVSFGRPYGLARTMFAAGILHVMVSAGLLIAAGGRSDGSPAMEVVGLAVFAGIWFASAWLFRNAAR